tara:strand:+ start:5970 stop:6146 length:177 start_codon:yes stop_codon:yes gene_type:complete
MSALLEPSAIHGVDLSFLYPGSIGIIADRSAEEVILVDEMWSVDARGNHDCDRMFFCP